MSRLFRLGLDMNFLQLAQRLRQEAGASGNGPTAVTEITGESKRLVDWISTAWLEIQGLHDQWGFMREPFEFQAAQGTGQTTPTQAGLTDFRYWHRETLRCWRTALGITDEQWLVEWEYQVFRDTYRFNQNRDLVGRPLVFAVEPNSKALMFGPLMDVEYTVVGEYQRVPKPFVLATDTPDLQEHQHMVIVYKALEYYGLYESAQEVVVRAQQQYARLISQLEREQLPNVYLGNPLA
jgi:hypothetical protein